MTYQETLDFMFAQLPMYHRIGAAAYKADIQPTLDLMAALGNPERKFRSIHVAGTNGKGSVSHFLASILQEAGLKVGLYTSPHLVDFRERIRVSRPNGSSARSCEMIPKQEVVDFVATHYPLLTTHSLSFFEMTVGLAFDYFAREQVDIAVVEVGMGGRLDSTNVITPMLSVITNIGLDHTQFLGDTLEKIAFEKAGIIKEGVPVVIGETQPETEPVFRRVAAEHHAPITFADQHYKVENGKRRTGNDEEEYIVTDLSTPHSPLSTLHSPLSTTHYPLPTTHSPLPTPHSPLSTLHSPLSTLRSQLTGEYQKKNIATVLQAVDVLNKVLHSPLSTLHLQRGLARVVSNTHLMGRWQTIGTAPLTICETAHNAPGIEAMLRGIENTPHRNLHIIYGCVNDKDYRKILDYLNSHLSTLHSPLSTPHYPLTWYFSQPSVPRGLPVEELQTAAADLGIHGDAYQNVKDAIAAARKNAGDNDLVIVTGSIFLIADALTPPHHSQDTTPQSTPQASGLSRTPR